MLDKYVSGIRPSGKLHLGNYLGAIRHWKKLQETEDCLFFIANMHSQCRQDEYDKTYKSLKRCGIKNIVKQSFYKHGILCLMHDLSFYANTSRLDNMTQYKEKGGTLALYSYPVLMAADIFYHKATHVPIGDDQKQHLELVRELARRTGRIEPQAVVNPIGARIMGLKDPTKKMSKSDANPDQCIYLCDSTDEIKRKIKGAATTPEGVANLLEIIKALDGEFEYTGHNAALKEYIADLIIGELHDTR